MCNLGQGLEDRGRREGRRKGLRQGRREGRFAERIFLLNNAMETFDFTAEQAMTALKIPSMDWKECKRMLDKEISAKE